MSADEGEDRRAGNRWSSAPDDAEAARLLLNRRVAFFGGLFFLLSLAFYVRNVAMIAVTERTWPPFDHPALVIHVAAILLAGSQWLLCRSGRRSRAAVDLIDAGGLIASMTLYCALVFAEAIAREHAVAVHSAGAEILLVALILLALILTHAIIVPATVPRALALSLACGALGTLTAYVLTAEVFPPEMLRDKPWLPWAEAMYVGMWAGLAVTVATIAARVIHGLKQRMQDANKVGQYTLEEKIGEGGMGIVYLARHALLRRATAVKLLHPERGGETALRRFEQEARITSTLTHPSTIAIFDFGRTPDGVFYYAMEYLDGITLADLIAHEGAQKPARVVQILRQVCGSLDEAHSAALIHRDIKPANLMLCVRGRIPDQVKVLDFGLVKDRGEHVGPGLSAEGTMLGTPAYLAPEAILDPATVDARADLYALGAVGYELLVGRPVFEGGTIVELSLHHLQSEPVPPSLRSAEPIPLALEQLVLRCLAKDPAERPASAGEMDGDPGRPQGHRNLDDRRRARLVARASAERQPSGARSAPRRVHPGASYGRDRSRTAELRLAARSEAGVRASELGQLSASVRHEFGSCASIRVARDLLRAGTTARSAEAISARQAALKKGLAQMSTRSSFLGLASTLALLLANGCGADAHDMRDGDGVIAFVDEPISSERDRPRPDYSADELEALAASAEVASLNSPFDPPPEPSESLHVTVSDGTRLALSVYFPEGFQPDSSRAPVVYIESWYPRSTVEASGEAIDLYRQAGFVVVIGDPRGFGASFGAQPGFLLARVRRDQQEVIRWLRGQRWANGKVAAVGFSISATHAEAMAASGAPGLRAAIIRESDFDNYTNNLFPGGIPNTASLDFVGFLLAWMRGDICADVSQCMIPPVDTDHDFSLLTAAFADHQANPRPEAFKELVYRDDPIGNGTVAEMSAVGHIDEARATALPARVSASWLDGTTAEAALRRFTELSNVPMEVFIGSHTHSSGLDADPFSRKAFEPARPTAHDQYAADVAFVKRVLAGEAIGRSVRYSVLGAGTTKTTTLWPPRGMTSSTLYFTRSGLTSKPIPVLGERRYTVDPATSSGTFTRWAAQTGAPVYYGDRRFSPGRRLSFDAAPVTRDMELVGAPEVCIVMRSDRSDGIVLAYLEDVAPNGRVTYLTEGTLRLLHRKTKTGGCDAAAGTERTFARADGAPVIPGELMAVELPLLPTAALIRKGHHLRVSFAGADAGPRRPFEFPTSGVDTFPMLTDTPATWSVALGGPRGSRLTVPLRPWSS